MLDVINNAGLRIVTRSDGAIEVVGPERPTSR